jgi:CheY-like chemotaxis protein
MLARLRPRVLIVDDEDNIVLALHRVLYQDNARYDVLLARTAEIAHEILRDAPVDVLVTDVHLPGRSGMDLLSWVAGEAPATRVIVMTAYDITGIKDRVHAYGCLRLVRKPFDVHEMRAAILAALEQRDTVSGSLATLSIVDVLQMLCISKKSVTLRLADGPSSGAVLIEGGQVIHAVWDDLVGEDAFHRLIAAKEGVFSTSPLPPDVERTLNGDWQYLLIDGLRKLDEAAAAGDEEESQSCERTKPVRFSPFSLPPEQGPRSVRPAPSEVALMASRPLPAPPPFPRFGGDAPPPESESKSDVSRLVDAGFMALRAGRRDEARRLWEDALRLDPGNRVIELNLRKLEGKIAQSQR